MKVLYIKNFVIGVLILFMLAVSSCKKEKKIEEKPDEGPVACFDATPRYADTITRINFKNCSQNYERVEWNFGDGETSSDSNPFHQWRKKGIYDITMKAFKGSESSTLTKKIGIGNYVNLSMAFDFYNWHPAPDCNAIQASMYLCKASNIQGYYKVICQNSYTRPVWNGGVPLRGYIDISDASENYCIKLVFEKIDGSRYTLLDSVLTKEFDIVNEVTKGSYSDILTGTADLNILTTYYFAFPFNH